MLPTTKRIQRVRLCGRRFVSYHLPSIRLLDSLKSENSGVPGLYSSKTVEDLWYKRGQALVDNLNSQVEKQKVENAPANLDELIRVSYSKPGLQELFTNASLLHNLQFYLESLKTNPNGSFAKAGISALLETPSTSVKVANEPSNKDFAEWIVDTFGSMAEFKTLLLNSAASIKGDGTTWLVAQATYSQSAMHDGASAGVTFNNLAIMNTYNAGIVDDSIKSGQLTKMRIQKLAKMQAADRRELELKELAAEVDEATPVLETKEEQSTETPVNPMDEITLGSIEEAEEILFSDRKLVPLLAIDASTRSYLEDYGLYGKRHYLENVWNCIDWDVVASRTPTRYKPSMVFEY